MMRNRYYYAIDDAQKNELDNRLNDYLANPNDVLSWQEVKTAALKKIQLCHPKYRPKY